MKPLLGITPLLEKYLLLLRTKKSFINLLYPEMQDLLIVFMKWHIKPEILEGNSTSEIIKMMFSNEDHQFTVKKIDFGKEAENYLQQFTDSRRKVACMLMKDLYVSVI